jgi:hypothetical protein
VDANHLRQRYTHVSETTPTDNRWHCRATYCHT